MLGSKFAVVEDKALVECSLAAWDNPAEVEDCILVVADLQITESKLNCIIKHYTSGYLNFAFLSFSSTVNRLKRKFNFSGWCPALNQ